MTATTDSTEARTTARQPSGLRRRLGAMLAWASAALDGDAVASTELLRLASEACLISAADGRVVFANDAYRALLSGDGVPDLSAVFPRDAKRLAELAELAAAGRPARATLSRLKETGNETWLDVEVRLLERPAGAIAWYLTEATGRIELGRALADERAGLGDVLDDTGIGFCIVDQKGRILSANRTLAGWLGYEVGALVGGMRASEIATSDIDLAASPEALAGNASAVSCEAKLCACDGQTLDVVVTQTAFRNPESGGYETHTIVRNPSREREREAALKLAEERFRRFFDFAPVAVATVDEAGLIMEANPVFRGWVAEGVEVVDQPLAALASEDHRDDVRRYIAQAWEGGTLEGGLEVRLDEAQMGNRLMQLYLSRLEDAEGGTNGLLLHFIDITEQRDLEVQFAQSQKMQAVGQLAGGVAHDFNNLLTAIIGHTDLLMLRFSPGDEAFPDIMQVKQNANRAANLVRQLLAFSRRQTLRPKVLSLTDVLAELTHLLRRLIGENIELKVVHGRDVDLVKADENQLEQVIINLAVNARDAMSTGGALEIATENIHHDGRRLGDGVLMAAGDYVRIQVRDTGTGMPQAELEKIFEPFYTTKGPGAGTGLGLSTVYGIVKQTGGFIFAESAVGEGTTFHIYLPALKSERGETAAALAAEVPAVPRDLTGKGTVMLVEDEDAVRIFAARALRNKGYEVLEANGGELALDILGRHEGEIDLLISDVVMPQMDGPTLIKKVRTERPDLKVIFISGYAESAFREHLDEGADYELLPKPFSLQELASKVKEVLEEA